MQDCRKSLGWQLSKATPENTQEGKGNSQPRTIIARGHANHDLHGPRTLSWGSPNSMPYTPPWEGGKGEGAPSRSGRGNGEGEAALRQGRRGKNEKGKRGWMGRMACE